MQKIILITFMLVISGCSHTRDMTEEEQKEYMQEEERKELRDLTGKDIMF
jgi:Tfp pilus assembly protein PilP